MPTASTTQKIVALGVVYVVWGSTYLAIRYVVETMPPLTAAGARFVAAGAILFTFLQCLWPTRVPLIHWRNAALIGGLLLLGGNGLVCIAQQKVPSGLTALMVGTAPIWFAVLDWTLFRGPAPTARIIAGLICGTAGVIVLVGPARLGAATFSWGPAIALLAACFFWPLGSLASRRVQLPASPFLSTAIQMLAGGALQLLVGLALGEWSQVHPENFTLRSWLAWGYLLVFGSILAFSCYVWLLRVVAPSIVATYAYVNPMIAMGLGVLVGGESVSATALISAGLIVAAVVLITTSPKTPPVPARRGSDEPDVPIPSESAPSEKFAAPRQHSAAAVVLEEGRRE